MRCWAMSQTCCQKCAQLFVSEQQAQHLLKAGLMVDPAERLHGLIRVIFLLFSPPNSQEDPGMSVPPVVACRNRKTTVNAGMLKSAAKSQIDEDFTHAE